MEFLRNLSLIAEQIAERVGVKYVVNAIEPSPWKNWGNSVKTHTGDKIIPRQGSLSQYESVRHSCRKSQ